VGREVKDLIGRSGKIDSCGGKATGFVESDKRGFVDGELRGKAGQVPKVMLSQLSWYVLQGDAEPRRKRFGETRVRDTSHCWRVGSSC
jgi:hypothetical protein